MNIYKLFTTSEPKHKRYMKYGNILNIKLKNQFIKKFDIVNYKYIYSHYDQIEKLFIEIKDESQNNPYPDFLKLNLAYTSFTPSVLTFLKELNISFEPLSCVEEPTNIEYILPIFTPLKLINFQLSNVEINNNGDLVSKGETYFSPLNSKIILNKNAIEKIQDIHRLQELPNTIICNEEIKEKLEKQKFSGVIFELLEIER